MWLSFILLFIIYEFSYAVEIVTISNTQFFPLHCHSHYSILGHSVPFVIPWIPHLQEWGHSVCLPSLRPLGRLMDNVLKTGTHETRCNICAAFHRIYLHIEVK